MKFKTKVQRSAVHFQLKKRFSGLKDEREKISPTWRRLYETHIFAKFLDFGQNILPVIYVKLSCHSKIGSLDSAQRKIGGLNFTKRERNLKPAGRNWTNTTARRGFLCLSHRFKSINFKSILHILFGYCVNHFLDNYYKQALIRGHFSYQQSKFTYIQCYIINIRKITKIRICYW